MLHIETAKALLGKLEKKNNSGFVDEAFENDMIKYGLWQPGYAWCMCFVRMVLAKTYPGCKAIALITPSVIKSFDKLKSNGYTIYKEPKSGHVAFMSKVKNNVDTGKGHTYFVDKVLDIHHTTIEGNSNDEGGREGKEVASITRSTNYTKNNGLRHLGFINILEK